MSRLSDVRGSLNVGKVSQFRVPPEQSGGDSAPAELTAHQEKLLAYKYGNRKTRRRIAKKSGLFKDHTNKAWRESNRMIRENDKEIRLND